MAYTIIFDLGNVLVEVDKTKMARQLSLHSQFSAEQIMAGFSNTKLTDEDLALSTGKITPQDFYEAKRAQFKLKGISFEEFKRIYGGVLTPVKEMIELVGRLKTAGHKIGLLSNTDPIHIEQLQINHPEVLPLFDFKVLSYEVKAAKPDTVIFQTALKASDSKPENTIYVDDLPEYVRAASSIGIKGIHFNGLKKIILKFKSYGVAV